MRLFYATCISYFFSISCCFLLFSHCQRSAPAVDYEAEKSVVTDQAMVVSAHPLASDVGAAILRQGGNAVDAAVAVQFALAVVYPRAGNIGGGGFLVIRQADGSTDAIDYVITHELCHIKHHHHGPAFTSLMNKVMPDWERRKDKLEQLLA